MKCVPLALSTIVALSTIAGCRSMFASGDAEAADFTRVSSKVAIVLDGTESFSKHLDDAAQIIKSFLMRNAAMGDAEVFLYRLDKSPKLIGRIPAASFLNADQKEIVQKLQVGSEGTGTDLVTAIEVAADKLTAKSKVVSDRHYLLVFSDGIVDDSKDDGKVTHFRSLSELDPAVLDGIAVRFFFLDHAPYKEIQSHLSGPDLDILLYEDGETISSREIQEMVEGY